MLIKKSKTPITETEIISFENKYDLKLPKDYYCFLLKNNGGIPYPNIFDFEDILGQTTNSLVQYFYAIYNKNGYDNLENNFILYKNERRIPENILPIAEDPFGNMVCISFDGKDYGSVYFWDHELEDQKMSYKNLFIISDNFNTFLSGLHE